MNHKREKLENPVRLKELNPKETLLKIGLRENYILCDIGAGSGIFTIPAARITQNKVYALEISEEMLALIAEKAQTEGLANIEPIKVRAEGFALKDNSVDIALLVTVLHEIEQPIPFLEEIKRILQADGKIAVIEFHKRETPMGPPVGHRMGKEAVSDCFKKIGFKVCKEFDLGDNFYCLIFQSSKQH